MCSFFTLLMDLMHCAAGGTNKFKLYKKDKIFEPNLNFLIHLSLQQDGINIKYFKLRLFHQTGMQSL